MNADHQFIIAIIQLVLGGFSTVAVAFIGYLTATMKTKLEHAQKETRENLGELAKSINGVKSEVVAAARSAAFNEGAKLESERVDSPEADQRAVDRRSEIIGEATLAASESRQISAAAEKSILEVPK